MKLIIDNKEIDLELANSFFKRLKGFMFQKNINYALRFKTKSIHTFFMKEPIDILMTTKDNKILYLYRNVKKNRILMHKNVYYVYEFPNNFLHDIEKNSIIKIQE